MEVNKIYWITHPAFYLSWTTETYKKKDIEKYFEKRLYPLIEQAKKENAVIVFVSSPTYFTLNPDRIKRNNEISELENAFKKKIKEELGKKAIITTRKEHIVPEHGLDLNPELIANEVKARLKENRFKTSHKTEVYGFGSDWRYCSRDYPFLFRETTKIKGGFHIPVWGSLMSKPSEANKEKRLNALKQRNLFREYQDIPKSRVYSPESLSQNYKARKNHQKSKKPKALKPR
ncbi:MAG: hypothetical protein JW703_01565 [Candidatus Diapherotrites archaeon]|nr:hypothetical protein [Candidatus Diapherotrites archaeon]